MARKVEASGADSAAGEPKGHPLLNLGCSPVFTLHLHMCGAGLSNQVRLFVCLSVVQNLSYAYSIQL